MMMKGLGRAMLYKEIQPGDVFFAALKGVAVKLCIKINGEEGEDGVWPFVALMEDGPQLLDSRSLEQSHSAVLIEHAHWCPKRSRRTWL
jgi:hypothetical protein